MNYSVFEQMHDGAYAREADEPQQAYMERVLQEACTREPDGAPKRVNDMLEPVYCGCDAAEQTLTLEFEVRDWMQNPNGVLHGGILTTAMDMTLGLLARFCRQTSGVVTVQLSMNFLRAVACGEIFRISAKAEKVGSRAVFMSGKAIVPAMGKPVANATAIFM